MKINKTKYPHCYVGHEYALQVVSGKILACKYVIGSCSRYLEDIENKDAEFYFDIDRAEKYLRLVQRFEHPIGVWGTKTIVYEPWQCFAWMNIMGFYLKESKTRRFRIAHIEIPRGNSKSTMASQCALYFLALDNPSGNQISTVATHREQARIVLDSARAMANRAAAYRKKTGVKVLAHSIVHDISNSKVRALSSDASGLDGLQDVLAITDELHAMRRDTFDTIYSGMSKRKDSLTLCITTAGSDVTSVGFTQSTYAKKVAIKENGLTDEQFFSLVYTVDEGDDVFEESTWAKANPNWGVSVDPVTFSAKASKAQVTPADLPNFKIKHLNMWISEANAFFDVAAWNRNADKSLKMENFRGEKCFAAVDLASKIDIASVASVFRREGKYYVFDKSYIPEETVKSVRNDVYLNSIDGGYLIKTPGSAINYDSIFRQIQEDSKIFKIQDVMVDPWNSLEFSQKLMAARIETTEFRMNVGNFSEPTKTMDALIREGNVIHNGSPLLSWCLGNVICTYDALDNVLPKKSNERLKIDPIIAIIMAMAAWLKEKQSKSAYEDRGILIL
jgi:phage terminase large subunit-like protein